MVTGFDVVGVVLALFPIVIHTVESYRRRTNSDDLTNLGISLKNRSLIYRNAVEELLFAVFAKDEFSRLLEDPTGSRWSEPDTTMRLTEYLGNDANELFDTAKRITKLIKKLNEQLPPLLDSAPGTVLSRAKKIAKIFLKGSEQKASITALANLVDEFCMLSQQNLRLAPVRRIAGEPFKRLLLHHTTGSVLYDLIQSRYHCGHEEHIINLKLESGLPDKDWTGLEPSFTFMCELVHVGADSAAKKQWQYANIVPLSSAGSETSKSSSTSSLGQEFLDTKEQDISDLCEYFTKVQTRAETSTMPLGYLMDDSGQKFVVSTDTEKHKSGSPVKAFRLSKLHEPIGEGPMSPTRYLCHVLPGFSILTIAQRISLALTLAMSIVRLQPTHWIEHHWTSEHICLINRPTERLQPYITHSFQPSRRPRRLSLTPSMREKPPTWIRNETLFNLCIVLIELCYGVPIERLQTEEDKDMLYMTALRLANHAESSFGVRYQNAILGCLHCNADAITAESSDEEREQFQRAVYQSIIQPLQDAHKVFAKA